MGKYLKFMSFFYIHVNTYFESLQLYVLYNNTVKRNRGKNDINALGLVQINQGSTLSMFNAN